MPDQFQTKGGLNVTNLGQVSGTGSPLGATRPTAVGKQNRTSNGGLKQSNLNSINTNLVSGNGIRQSLVNGVPTFTNAPVAQQASVEAPELGGTGGGGSTAIQSAIDVGNSAVSVPGASTSFTSQPGSQQEPVNPFASQQPTGLFTSNGNQNQDTGSRLFDTLSRQNRNRDSRYIQNRSTARNGNREERPTSLFNLRTLVGFEDLK